MSSTKNESSKEETEEQKKDNNKTVVTTAETRMDGNNKRVYYVNRKVAIMEEVHLQNSGKSLQEQMHRVQNILKNNVEKVGHLEVEVRGIRAEGAIRLRDQLHVWQAHTGCTNKKLLLDCHGSC